ncbi:hypothetical protein K8640_19520 [Myxococcus sp. XM-1-1-1]|uniref:hypothetical protein n=1 Tax=Myxococcus TaxID=32 RepID=UPI001CBFC415|nr:MULTISPECIES: hypothetical protein [Myxococcus]MBZ4410402.1 hypothetical protein [Myxococcus sp. XM-1-1-1]MCK8503028.1 hypothetical protein [Myxococcus fulvus]
MRGNRWAVSGLLVALVTSPCLAEEQWRPHRDLSPECLLDASHAAVRLRFGQYVPCFGGNWGSLTLTHTPVASRIEGDVRESRRILLNVSSRVLPPFVSQQMFRALVDGALQPEGTPKCRASDWAYYAVTFEWTCDTRSPEAWRAASFHASICDEDELSNLPSPAPRETTSAHRLYRTAHLMLREALR